MNKKLLFAAMSLAALTACTTDDFESQQPVAEGVSSIQFEVINDNDAETRASMNGNKIAWSATDGDLFTLYHGGTGIVGYENATYKASAAEGEPAVLTTPSMIKAGAAVMVWPADTTFRIGPADNLSIVIPADQTADIENNIPYMSDQITIGAYAAYSEVPPVTAYNTAGKDRKYPVFMRPMASQLIVKADYAGTDATLATLEDGDDGIDPIEVTSIELLTTEGGGGDDFTTDIDVKFTAPTAAITAQWGAVANNAWTNVTDFDLTAINASADKLTTKCLIEDNGGAKFLILPQNAIAGGVDDGAVVVNTIYGKVVIATPGTAGTLYTVAEAADAWYRYISAASKAAGAGVGYDATETPAATAESDGKFKTTSAIENGMMQTINGLSTYTHQAAGVVKGEPEGAATTRYVKVLLTHLDMTDLHIKTDKQLRDAARVWKQMGLADVTVYLDGNATTGEFEISQNTISVINTINAATAGKSFKVKPCNVAGEVCNEIVITGGGNVPDLAFIVQGDAANTADVVLKAGENWSWSTSTVDSKKAVTVAAATTGIANIINEGTFASNATATIAIYDNASPAVQVSTIPFVNDGTWNITGGDLTVQFDVTNNGTVNISNGAEYHQDIIGANATTFINEATTLPERFLASGTAEEIGLVVNKGVLAVTGNTTVKGIINNYGLIKHDHVNAKTYITANEIGGDFHTAFTDPGNKMGMISLPWDNKDEDNISVTAALNQGFIAVTVNGEVTGALDATQLGTKVNYLIVKAGPTSIADVATQVDYLEIDMTDDSELAWSTNQAFEGLVVLSPVNIKLGSTITVNGTGATYLGAKMYVGGTFTNTGGWSGYYGDTTTKVPTYYITY